MSVQNINYNHTQPIKVPEINKSNNNGNFSDNRHKRTYVPLNTELADGYCDRGYCSGRFINYLI